MVPTRSRTIVQAGIAIALAWTAQPTGLNVAAAAAFPEPGPADPPVWGQPDATPAQSDVSTAQSDTAPAQAPSEGTTDDDVPNLLPYELTLDDVAPEGVQQATDAAPGRGPVTGPRGLALFVTPLRLDPVVSGPAVVLLVGTFPLDTLWQLESADGDAGRSEPGVRDPSLSYASE